MEIPEEGVGVKRTEGAIECRTENTALMSIARDKKRELYQNRTLNHFYVG